MDIRGKVSNSRSLFTGMKKIRINMIILNNLRVNYFHIFLKSYYEGFQHFFES